MKYGHFDDKAKEYVITTPKTPHEVAFQTKLPPQKETGL